jgi:DNA-binding transcriptional LysR family regulator
MPARGAHQRHRARRDRRQFQVGVIPGHRRLGQPALRPAVRRDHAPVLRRAHALFSVPGATLALDWAGAAPPQRLCRPGLPLAQHGAGQQMRLPRKATGFDQEAIATLILSGRFLGFLPDHYAEPFVQRGRMQAVQPSRLRYECDFVSVLRRSPQPPRAAEPARGLLHQQVDGHRADPRDRGALPPADRAPPARPRRARPLPALRLPRHGPADQPVRGLAPFRA